MVQNNYVSLGEFNAFKAMTQEKLKENENKIDILTELMISSFDRVYEQSDRKFRELTDIVMDGFERVDKKIDRKVDGLRKEMKEQFDLKFIDQEVKFNLRFEALDEKFERRFIEADEKMENLTELMMDGFDMLRDKIEESRN